MADIRSPKAPPYPKPESEKPARVENEARRSEALRANLHRRKAQSRARQEEGGGKSGK